MKSVTAASVHFLPCCFDYSLFFLLEKLLVLVSGFWLLVAGWDQVACSELRVSGWDGFWFSFTFLAGDVGGEMSLGDSFTSKIGNQKS